MRWLAVIALAPLGIVEFVVRVIAVLALLVVLTLCVCTIAGIIVLLWISDEDILRGVSAEGFLVPYCFVLCGEIARRD